MNFTLVSYGYKFNKLIFNCFLYNFKASENANLRG